MNWSRKKIKTLECPFPLQTIEAYDWFVHTVGGRPIRWSNWPSSKFIFIKKWSVVDGSIKDQSGHWWNIYGGFSNLGLLGSHWEFADELE